MGNPSAQAPNIFTFINYRNWLGQAFSALQAGDESLTHRKFSKMCGYRSSGAIALIISGKRRLTDAGAKRIAKAVGLPAAERQHLLWMVSFEQTADFDERARLLKKMQTAQRFAETWSDSIKAYEFYGEWFLPVLREMVSLPDFKEDPRWIARRMHAPLAPRLIKQGIDKLIDLGYLTRAEDGLLSQSAPIIATSSELRSDVLKQHQRDMMRLASDALDTQPPDVRDMRVMTVAISVSQAERIKARLTQLQKELLEIVVEDEPIEGVFQLNTQWFGLTVQNEDDTDGGKEE